MTTRDRRNAISLRGMKLLLFALAILLALTASGVAAAQIAYQYDMACRGTFASAGGVRQYTNNRAVISSVGQAGVGLSTSATRGLRAGYIQPAAHAASVALESAQATDQEPVAFLPIAGVLIPVPRLCSW